MWHANNTNGTKIHSTTRKLCVVLKKTLLVSETCFVYKNGERPKMLLITIFNFRTSRCDTPHTYYFNNGELSGFGVIEMVLEWDISLKIKTTILLFVGCHYDVIPILLLQLL